MGELIGYARINSFIKATNNQQDDLTAAGCSKIYTDYVSGPMDARPELEKALASLQAGDTLVVTSLDRPGRSLQHVLSLAANLAERSVDLMVLNGSLDSRKSERPLVFPVLACLSEMEKNLALERISSRPSAPRPGGRPPLLTPKQTAQAYTLYGQGKLTVAEIGARLGVSRATVYRAIDTVETDAASVSVPGGSDT